MEVKSNGSTKKQAPTTLLPLFPATNPDIPLKEIKAFYPLQTPGETQDPCLPKSPRLHPSTSCKKRKFPLKESRTRQSTRKALVPRSLQVLKDKFTGPPREVSSTPQQRSPFLQGPVTGLKTMYPADECQSLLKHQQVHLRRTLHHWEKPMWVTRPESKYCHPRKYKIKVPNPTRSPSNSSDSDSDYEATAPTSPLILNTRPRAISGPHKQEYCDTSGRGKQRKPGTWVSESISLIVAFCRKQHAARQLDIDQLPSGRMRNPNSLRVLNKFLQNLEKVNLQVLYNCRVSQMTSESRSNLRVLNTTSGSRGTSGSISTFGSQNDLRVLNTTSGSRETSGFPIDLRVPKRPQDPKYDLRV
ncbi:hypothetical protein DY000_02030675 [Brassica cretica]|uniref:Uncharacterized protein n=1 Tax=Brassica cretica TaxID=69181 RepID=A0ABQ7DIY4_BRACR|nr:hypothetical protein DY000_02030675 [Brassica cretica]